MIESICKPIEIINLCFVRKNCLKNNPKLILKIDLIS